MTTLVHKSSPFAGQGPGFNHAVAEAVYSTIMKCASDDEARMLSTVLLSDMLTHEMVVHGREIAKAAREVIAKRTADINTKLLEVAVTQRQAGGDPMPALRAIETLDVISKAAFGDEGFSFPDSWPGGPRQRAQSRVQLTQAQIAQLRAEHARNQKRDLLTGKFVQEHKSVVHLNHEKGLHDKDAALLGIPSAPSNLSHKQRAIFQRGYREVKDLLDRYDELDPSEIVLHMNYSHGPGEIVTPIKAANGKLAVPVKSKKDLGSDHPASEIGLDPYRKLQSVQLSVKPSIDLDGPGVQARFGDALSTGGLLHNDTWDVTQAGSLGDELTRSTQEEQFTPGARALRRVGSLAEALHTSIDNDKHPRLSLALKVGQKAGELGPEAQKVIGPAADRAAYRYRGTQRKTVDERLRNAFSSLRGPGKRDALIHGMEDDQGNWHEGQVLRYFRTRLPRADLNTLQRKSGTIPPSEGVIIDRKGNAAVQAIGYADDHYLPFNLKNLAKLKGGEYIRTRTFGGPTTEDVYTGLIGGAKSLTVVSHNGVYTMEFDDDLKGGRRFNDKAARMVARYGQLLDAVQSQQVVAGSIHPSRMAELEEKANAIYDPERDPDQYNAELDRLKAAEKRKPQLSARQQQEISAEFFSEMAARAHLDATGFHGDIQGATNRPGVSGGEFARDWALRQVATMEARNRALAAENSVGYHPLTAGQREQQAHRLLEQAGGTESNPVVAAQKLADAMGVRRQLDSFVERKSEEYKKGLTPLQLNSQGYALALTALQEQFPYYIKRVDFHPWTDGAGSPFDTGYVAPRHNRPHQVLAGYFNEKITGHGKVHADSTRFQNFGVRQGKLDSVLTPKAREEKRVAAGGGTARAAAPAGSHAAAPDAQTAAHLKREAARDLLSQFYSHTNFSSLASVPNAAPGAPAVAGEDIRAIAQGSDGFRKLAPNLWALFQPGAQEKFERQLQEEPEKVYTLLHGALRDNRAGSYLDIDATAKRNFENEGRYERPKAIDGQQAIEHLNDQPGTEYDIPGSVFNQDALHSPDEIEAAFTNDHVIGAIRDDLPDFTDGHAFDAALKDVRADLQKQGRALANWNAKRLAGVTPPPLPVPEHILQRKAEGLLRAQQLRTRHKEAVQRISALSKPSPITPSQVVEEHFHFPDADTAREFRESRGLPPGRNATIDE